MISVVYFGSFLSYSVETLDIITNNPDFEVTAVITTPPRPGDKLTLTKTPVQNYCEKNHLPVYPLENLNNIPKNISPPDFIIVSGYGKLIPLSWLNFPKFMAINIHQSLLPEYAGRFPAEWAILRGEIKTGVTLIKMSEKFDRGDTLAQESLPIDPLDTRETLYHKLYKLSGQLALTTLPKIISHSLLPIPQTGKGFYARQLTRQDGFIPYQFFLDSINHQTSEPKNYPPICQTIPYSPNLLVNMHRALYPWPGVWTTNPDRKRLKIISLNPVLIQFEGKKPVLYSDIKHLF